MGKKVMLVAGASGGIGEACVRELAKEGNTVLAHAWRHFDQTQAMAQSLCAIGQDVHAVSCDIGNSEETQVMCKSILATYHRIDGLLYCAGVSHTGLLCDMTDEEWARIWRVNVDGAFYLTRALAPGMVSRRVGSIVYVSSIWGRMGASCEAAYSASKAALIGFAQAMARELGPSGVRVNCVAPGVIDAGMMAEHTEETKRTLAEETPLARLGRPEEVAMACRFLLSDEASFITGQTLGVDGGFA